MANEMKQADLCDCRINVSTKMPPIAYCPLHAHAGELLEALCELGQATAPFISQAIGSRNPVVCAAIDKANVAIAKATGKV